MQGKTICFDILHKAMAEVHYVIAGKVMHISNKEQVSISLRYVTDNLVHEVFYSLTWLKQKEPQEHLCECHFAEY